MHSYYPAAGKASASSSLLPHVPTCPMYHWNAPIPLLWRETPAEAICHVVAADQAEGRHHRPDCPPFSCGHLRNISSPFRQASDPPWCGYESYELACCDTKAIIRNHNATYYVSDINYSDSTFWVLHADMDLYNGCPLPRSKRWAYHQSSGFEIELELVLSSQACFLTCSREVKDNSMYIPVACLSTNDTYVYVLTGWESSLMKYLEPSCGYLAMTPLTWDSFRPDDSSYAEVVKSMRSGFAVRFPYSPGHTSIKDCLMSVYREKMEETLLSSGLGHGLLFSSVSYTRVM